MTTAAEQAALVQRLDRVAQDVLSYFDGPGRTTGARVDEWQARDVLQHFIYYHDDPVGRPHRRERRDRPQRSP